MKDPHRVRLDGDVDVVAHQPIGHAVADGVDIDEGVMGDAPAKALLAASQCPLRQGTQRVALLAVEADDRRVARARLGAARPSRGRTRDSLGERAPCRSRDHVR